MTNKKRFFQKLDTLNLNDIEKGTEQVGVCLDYVSGQSAHGGGLITMGVPPEIFNKIIFSSERYKPILVIIDMQAFEQAENS